MRLFLDTEFDGYQGSLISIALVSEFGDCYYDVVADAAKDPWVMVNVIPKLRQCPVDYKSAQGNLDRFLQACRFVDSGITVVADWPDDIVHFCRMLITGSGERFGGDINFELWDFPPYPANPMRHNALQDARMLRDAYMTKST